MQNEAYADGGLGFVLHSLRHAFVNRLAEWVFAFSLLGQGIGLAAPQAAFDRPAWVVTKLLMTETTLAWVLMALGIARLLVLAANGAWRPMYPLRALLAGTSSIVWFMLGIGFLGSGEMGLWVGVFPVFFVFDAINMRRAIGDAYAAEAARRIANCAGTGGHDQ